MPKGLNSFKKKSILAIILAIIVLFITNLSAYASITKVEEKERTVSRNFWNWWIPVEVVASGSEISDKILPQIPDFTVEKTAKTGIADDKLVFVNSDIEYTIKITNNGDTELKNIEVTDKIPEQTTFVSMDNQNNGNTIKENDIITGVIWKVSIPAKKSIEVKFKVKVNQEASGVISNVAIVNGRESNEEKTSIIKSEKTSEIIDGLEVATLGDKIRYKITATNTGNISGTTTIKDTVPIGTELIESSVEDSGEISIIEDGRKQILWDVEIPANNKIERTFIVEVKDIKQKIENIATVGGVPTNPDIIETEDRREQKGTVTVKGVKSSTESVSTPMDVVFVLDTSGSMKFGLNNNSASEDSRAKSMVNAVNSSIKTIMSKNADSRIGVVGFSGDASTIIPLEKYDQNINYLTREYSENNKSDTQKIVSNVGDKKSRTVTGGTNTQAGIKEGAEMLINSKNKKYTTTIDGNEITVTRTPVLILVTDGEPTYYYESEKAKGNRIGDGMAEHNDENYYYWTIRTAKFYKNQITSKYYKGTTNNSKVFTIGIGMSGDKATTTLNPNETNVKNCDLNGYSDGMIGKYRNQTGKLYDLLNSNKSPYAYDYADATKTGSLTEEDIKNFLITSIENSQETSSVRKISDEENKNRKIILSDFDVKKEFNLTVGETVYNTVDSAKKYGYLKQNTDGNYYIDLTLIDRDTNVDVLYWKK